MSIVPISVERHHYAPQGHARKGCPCHLTPSYQETSLPDGERTRLIHEYTTMMLAHISKLGVIKNHLHLAPIHHELELDSLTLQNSGASNILVSKVSFDCLITTASGEEVRGYIHFDLRIPGTNIDDEGVLSYEMLVKIYGGKAKLYSAMKSLYTFGRQIASNGYKHGHVPEYDPTSKSHDQYIRHTEQFLVAYLARPEAAEMLRNRLRVEIRAKYPGPSSVKVYNMGLHMHSTKTCCGTCEYSLVGLMGQPEQLNPKDEPLPSFRTNFARACLEANEQLTITLPKKSSFQLLVTVTASNADSTHQKQPTYKETKLDSRDFVPSHIIKTKDPQVSEKIHVTKIDCKYDQRRLPTDTYLSDKTVGISGSKSTKGSSGTIGRVRSVRTKEITEIGDRISSLKKYVLDI